MPDIIYYPLNNTLFQGRPGDILLRSFGGDADYYHFPANQLLDGIHQTPIFTARMWGFLESCVTKEHRRLNPIHVPITAPPVSISVPTETEVQPSTSHNMPRPRRQQRKRRTTPYQPPRQSIRKSIHQRLRDNRWETTSSEEVVYPNATPNRVWRADPSSNRPSTSSGVRATVPPPIVWDYENHQRTMQRATNRLVTLAAEEHMDDLRAFARAVRRRGMAAVEAGEVHVVNQAGRQWASHAMRALSGPSPGQTVPFPDLLNSLPELPPP
ncbi:unnamed protein product [Rotaria magnacalcarata]|nr:unnamed protein product [Rotaria magnacalcarata]